MTDGLQPSLGSAFQAYQPGRCDGQGCQPVASSTKLLPSLTVSLVSTYQQCSPAFRYTSKLAPRRLLTKPAEPVSNSGWDNVNHDLIVAVGDEFVSTLGSRYAVKDLLGQGTFGQVFKCVCVDDGASSGDDDREAIAIKVVKNQAAYYHQARVEIGVLQFLNTRADPGDRHHIVRLKDFFLFRNHLCLAFELLSLNLYELIRHNKFRGLSLSLVRVFVNQILDAMVVLRDSRIIHCDLKPENVLLKNVESGEVKVIDFGSACFESRTVYSYIQSRFYRSPEVVLGYPYAVSIDMWSLGCVAAELFLGLPLFPGACEHDLLGRIISTLGPLPDFLLTKGKNARKFFAIQEEVVADGLTGEQLVRQRFLLRTRAQFEELTGQPAPSGKHYFQHSALADIIGAYPFRSGLSDDEVARERRLRESFTDFLLGVLDVNPSTRWTPRQAAQHPFVTGEKFSGPFQPLPDPSTSPAVGTPVPASVGSRPGSSLGQHAHARTRPQAHTPPAAAHRQQQPAPAVAAAASHMHTPGMQIPVAAGAGAGGGRSHQSAALAASAEQQAAALAAASPWAAAAAHAAAMAAMQARYGSSLGTSFQQPQQPYNVAHSLQAIMGGGGGAAAAAAGMAAAAQLASSYGVAAMHSTPAGQPSLGSSYAPLMSPPSRSFRTQLRYADFSSSLLQQQQLASADPLHGVIPMLQTPTSANHHQPFSPGSFQPSSFQPSSISTYQAALAAAQAALQQQQQAAAAGPGGLSASSAYQQQQQQQVAGSYGPAPTAGKPRGFQAAGASSWQVQGEASWAGPAASWQQQQDRGGPPWGAAPSAALPAAAAQAAAAAAATNGGLGVPLAAQPGGTIGSMAATLPAGMLQRQLLRSGLQQPGSAPAAGAGAGGSRWTSMDGSSPGGTPPLAAHASAEDIPNPADFDPLWNDALLEEEEQQAAYQAPHAKRQHMQAPEQPSGHASLPPRSPQSPPQRGHHRREPTFGQLAAPVPPTMQRQGGSAADALALAAQCLPQLQQLQQQQQAARQQQAVAAHQAQQQQIPAARLAPPVGGSFAFRSPFVDAQQQHLLQQQASSQQQTAALQAGASQQQQQADLASALSAFGRASAASGGADRSGSANEDAAAAVQQQQQQLLMLHKSLSLNPQHSTTLTDGFANYTLQDAPSLASAAAVAAAAAALSQQHSVTLGDQQAQQAAAQQAQQQALELYAAAAVATQQQQQQQQGQGGQHPLPSPERGAQQAGQAAAVQTPTHAAYAQQAAAADSVASMLWSPVAASQLLQTAVDAPPPASLLLGAGQQLQQTVVQYQQHYQQPPLQPLQRQQGFNL